MIELRYDLPIGLGNTEDKGGAGEVIAGGIFSIFTTLIGGTQKKNQDARALEQKKIDLQIEQSREAQARALASQKNNGSPPAEKDYTMVYWTVGGVLVTGAVVGGIYYFTK